MEDIYLSNIKKLRLLRYRNSPIFNKNFLQNYFKNRKRLYKKKFIIKNYSPKNRDFTLQKLMKIKKEKFSIENKEFLIKLYKKFEVNLALKSKYDKNGKKNTNKETHCIAYLILAELIFKKKLTNKIQFLNFLLKILDTISLKKNCYLNGETYKILSKLIILETKLVKKYVK